MHILLVGKPSGRLDCLAEAFKSSPQTTHLTIYTTFTNPSLSSKGDVILHQAEPGEMYQYGAHSIYEMAQKVRPDFVFISDEQPLADGVVDALQNPSRHFGSKDIRIPVIGPTKRLAAIESSKIFTRGLLNYHKLPVNPQYRVFYASDNQDNITKSLNLVEDFIDPLKMKFVIKPDGLTGGKGVRVGGDHIKS